MQAVDGRIERLRAMNPAAIGSGSKIINLHKQPVRVSLPSPENGDNRPLQEMPVCFEAHTRASSTLRGLPSVEAPGEQCIV